MTHRVALTGATGFIGRHLTAGLTDAGFQVRALSRRLPSKEFANPAVEWVRGDLSDGGALEALVCDATAVVHCGGAVRGVTREAFDEVNAAGTLRLARVTAAEPSAPRFLLISSIAAREPELSWYASSKLKGEAHLADAFSDDDRWTVFRPTAVYGEGDREMLPLFDVMRRGILPILGRRDCRLTLLHVEDLARAVLAWVEAPGPVPGVFELHDGTPEGYTWPVIAQIVGDAWNRPVRCVRVTTPILHSISLMALGLGRLSGRPPMLTPGKVRELGHPDWLCDNTPLIEALDWRPQVDLQLALRTRRPFVR